MRAALHAYVGAETLTRDQVTGLWLAVTGSVAATLLLIANIATGTLTVPVVALVLLPVGTAWYIEELNLRKHARAQLPDNVIDLASRRAG